MIDDPSMTSKNTIRPLISKFTDVRKGQMDVDLVEASMTSTMVQCPELLSFAAEMKYSCGEVLQLDQTGS